MLTDNRCERLKEVLDINCRGKNVVDIYFADEGLDEIIDTQGSTSVDGEIALLFAYENKEKSQHNTSLFK